MQNQIKDIKTTGILVPDNKLGYVAEAKYIKGSYIVVRTLSERDSLLSTATYKDNSTIIDGSLVYVSAIKKSYRYSELSGWVEQQDTEYAQYAEALANSQSFSLSNGATGVAADKFDGTKNCDIAVSSLKEAYLDWGGKNLSNSFSALDASLIPTLGANRFALLNPSAVTVEYSNNSGDTWVDYDAADADKVGLFLNGSKAFTIGKASATTPATAASKLRITLDTANQNIYTVLQKFCFYISTQGSTGCYCLVEKASQASRDVFEAVDTIPLGGWSGYNIMNLTDPITTYGNTLSQYALLRFTFGCTSHTSNYPGLAVYYINGFGGVGWSTPSTLAKTGRLYEIDSSGNAAFPADITATSLNGYEIGSSSAFNKLPAISAAGVMEGGRYLDWHYNTTSGSDYSCRLQVTADAENNINLPTASGTLALTADMPTIIREND